MTLGTTIVSAWGMSENGAITTTMLDDDPSRAIETDGCLPGGGSHRHDDGNTLPTGEIGVCLHGRAQTLAAAKRPISMQPMPTAGSIPVTSHELTIRDTSASPVAQGRHHSWR